MNRGNKNKQQTAFLNYISPSLSPWWFSIKITQTTWACSTNYKGKKNHSSGGQTTQPKLYLNSKPNFHHPTFFHLSFAQNNLLRYTILQFYTRSISSSSTGKTPACILTSQLYTKVVTDLALSSMILMTAYLHLLESKNVVGLAVFEPPAHSRDGNCWEKKNIIKESTNFDFDATESQDITLKLW